MNHHTVDIAWLTDDCERVSHLQRDHLYFAHLSIYWFALRFCTGKTVLDAGSGTGYGSAYLADNGAREVHGIDISEKAIDYSKVTFRLPNLSYQTMDLEQISGFPNHHFDVIFSSNVFEHIPDISLLMRRAWELLKSDGVMIVAVPPITNRASRQDNVTNPYHLNIWSPRQWFSVLGSYFGSVECFGHYFEQPGVALDFTGASKHPVAETDFTFRQISIDLMSQESGLTAVFVARAPLAEERIPAIGTGVKFVDESYTRPPYEPGFGARLKRAGGRLLRKLRLR